MPRRTVEVMVRILDLPEVKKVIADLTYRAETAEAANERVRVVLDDPTIHATKIRGRALAALGAAFQAERLAEAGYVLVHTAPDEATVERLARVLIPDRCMGGARSACVSCVREAHENTRKVLAALADTSAQAGHTADDATGGGAS